MEQSKSTAVGIELKNQGEDFLQFARSKKAEQGPIELISVDEKMKRITEVIDQIADANVPVLISGESGTGKEVIARMIHNASQRKESEFVAVNCAALPSNLLESELFGYEKGAFTGAHQRRIGKFEQASGGTLLLDEITEMELGLQAKLLRALQEKEIERIGGKTPVKINSRIIATTNRDLKTSVKSGEFRQDLYYRLYVIHLEIPPLRERQADIEALVEYYTQRFSDAFDKKGIRFSAGALDKLERYPWPGNVRELQNIVQRAILMSRGSVIEAAEIPLLNIKAPERTDWIEDLPLGKPMRDVETHFIIETLKLHNGNRTHAAKTLGISLRTLRNKINEFTAMGFTVPEPQSGKSL
jgi:two-component system, response regulator FlrC